MPNNIFTTSTLEYYNYGEQNNFKSAKGAFQVKVSDKDGNIITIEKDGSLFAMVGLTLSENVLTLLDKAHNDSVLAEVEFPDAGHISNCRFDSDNNTILFDIVTLKGDVETVEIDVESLVDVYEAGQGIEIGDKSAETGKKPISIKLANGEELLQLSDDGLGISDKVTTDEELENALSGKADISYVDEKIESIIGFSGEIDTIIGMIEHIEDVLGTDEDDPNIDERIDSKADLDEFNDLEEEVGEIETNVNIVSGKIETLEDTVEGLNVTLESQIGTEDEPDIYTIKQGDNVVGTIEVQKEKYIVDAKIVTDVHGIPYLVLIMNDGRKININLSKVFDDYTNGDGINIENHVVSIKLTDDEDNYLYVSEEGLKTTGITEAISAASETLSEKINNESNRAQDVEGQLWNAINGETTRAQEVEGQLWNGIAGEASARETIDNQLWSAVNGETTRAQEVEGQLWNAIGSLPTIDDLNNEIQNRISGDEALQDALNQEIQDRIDGDAEFLDTINAKVNEEKERAERAERAEAAAREEAIEEEQRRAEDAEQELAGEIRTVKNNMSGFTADLEEETRARIEKDNELAESIGDIRDTYATVEYVDTKDAETSEYAINTSINSAKTYVDNELDELEVSIKNYVDTQDNVLASSISDNTTKINAISNLKGVSGSDISNYDDSGNGILDVLHREFHELEAEIGYITNPTIQTKNRYEVAFGEYNISHTGESDAEKTMFSIGNGSSDEDRSNAIEVRRDGSVYMMIEGEYMKVNDLIGMLAHEIY